MKNLQYVSYEMYKNDKSWYSLTAYYKHYGFELVIQDIDTEEIVFEKFLRTQDPTYCGNYLRKVVKNNFNAVIA